MRVKDEGHPDVNIHLNTMSVCQCHNSNTFIFVGHAGLSFGLELIMSTSSHRKLFERVHL